MLLHSQPEVKINITLRKSCAHIRFVFMPEKLNNMLPIYDENYHVIVYMTGHS